MIKIIAAVVGSVIMIFLTIDLIKQWINSSKAERTSADLVVQWFFWLTIIMLIVISL